jgi:hypothetical protein
MDLKKVFGTSAKLEVEGVVVDLGDGGWVKVARAGNPENRKMLKRLIAPHKAALRSDRLPDDVLEKLTIKAMSETILLDWGGLEDEGKPLPAYTKEQGVAYLTKYKDFRDQIAVFSADLALYQEASTEAAAGNL